MNIILVALLVLATVSVVAQTVSAVRNAEKMSKDQVILPPKDIE